MVIATRVLSLDTGNKEIAVPVRLHAPEREGRAWTCVFEIGWPEGQTRISAHGEDAFQALIVALQMIAINLYTSDHHKAGRLHSEGWQGGYGFPIAANCRDLLVGDDAKYF